MADYPDLEEFTIAITAEADSLKAADLARKLLKQKLVACISIHKVDSYYWWEDELVNSQEFQLTMKTTSDHINKLQAVVFQLHSYDTPEWIQLPFSPSASYGKWINSVLPNS